MSVGRIGEYRLGTNASWDEYVERLEIFCAANKITTDEQKRAVLLSCCGEDTYGLIVTLVKPARPTAASYDDIKGAVRKHMHPRPSELYARFLFYRRNQAQGEAASEYVTALRKLAEDCGFGDKQLPLDVMMRDRFVCGIKNEAVQQRLLAERDLTFEVAYDMTLTAEVTEKQQRDIRKQAQDGTKESEGLVQATRMKLDTKADDVSCFRCNGKHAPHVCRFRKAACFKCKKVGHVAKACRSKDENRTPRKPTDLRKREEKNKGVYEMSALFSVCEVREQAEKFMVEVHIQGEKVPMEVDSGASCSIVSEETFRLIEKNRGQIPLQEAGTKLVTWSNESLSVVGRANVEVKFKGCRAELPLSVIKKRGNSLLGRSWFESLGIRLSGIQQIKVEDVTSRFAEVFGSDLPGFNGPPVHIELQEDARPVFLKSRPVPLALKDDVAKEVDRLVHQGVWEPVEYSNWATPLVVVRKKNGTLRLCGDYRSTVNKANKSSGYPLPTTAENLATLGSSKIFTKLDLTQAYQQLSLDDESAEMLTVNTIEGLCKVRRLPFGISVAPWVFQRVIDTSLAGIPGVKAYLDDILISGSNADEHSERLAAVLARLQRAQLRVNKEKCEFSQASIEFLRHRIDAAGIHPSQTKTDAIQQAPPPTSRKQLQAFLGLLNFYASFLKGKTEVAEPLHRLLDHEQEWKWTGEHQWAFEKLKKLLSSDAVLVPYDPKRPLVLCCDASPVGVGAVLAHRADDGKKQPIAYASRTLGASERNYAQIDKEGLAVVFGVKRFHQYLAGRDFTVVTDHKPLLGLFNTEKRVPEVLSPRMLRWILLLGAYNYRIQYRRGEDNSNADALSRLPIVGDEDEPQPPGDVLLLEAVEYAPLQAADIARMTKEDCILAKVKDWILSGWPSRQPDNTFAPYEVRKFELSLQRDCILWGNRVVIPQVARERVLQLLHANHPGMSAMKASPRGLMWWPKMDSQIEEFVRYCQPCQSNRQSDPKAPLHFWVKPDQPWSRLHIDFAGPVKAEVFLIVVDAYSNWAEVEIMPSMKSSAVVTSLRKMFATHGVPDVIVSDNGTAFIGAELQTFLKLNGVRTVFAAPYHPASNGRAERMVREVKEALKKQQEGTTQCKIARFLFKQHTMQHSVTGKSPAELMMGRRLRTALDRLHPDRQREPEVQASPTKCFAVGDAVYAKSFNPGPRWKAATVVEVRGPVSYTVQLDNGERHHRHRNQLRRA
ncbi:uncharacterized protein ISCGN_032945 [Ixodes scapularis]